MSTATPRRPRALVIVESPAKAKTIRKILGDGFVVEASFGHIRDLPEGASDAPKHTKGKKVGTLGIDIENGFKPIYVMNAKQRKQVTVLEKAFAEADTLFLATDGDREGEAIAWHLVQVLDPKVPVRRMVFHEITRKAIEAAMSEAREIDAALVEAQETRRIIDRLVGFMVSPVLWKKIGFGLSAGRVQSVALRLLVDRERERMGFCSAEWWDLAGTFGVVGLATGGFEATLATVGGVRIARGDDFDRATGAYKQSKHLLLDGAAAQALAARLANDSFTVAAREDTHYRKSPRAPFTTSSLQQAAAGSLSGFTAKRTMDVAQRLYEKGLITYMRTDSTHLADEAVAGIRQAVDRLYGADYVPSSPRLYQTKVANAQEAHEAIRPAGTDMPTPDSLRAELSDDEYRLYDLIWKRAVACQMTDERGNRTTLTLASSAHGGPSVEFRVSGTTVEFPGFTRAYDEGSDDSEGNPAGENKVLPAVAVGDRLECIGLEPARHITEPRARFTEATLTKRLEELGIGRPSTYAATLETLVGKKYCLKRGTALVPSWSGFAITQLLSDGLPALVDERFTARLEDQLDAISRGDEDRLGVLRRFYDGAGDDPGLASTVECLLGTLDPKEASSVRLPSGIVVRTGKYGPYVVVDGRNVSLPTVDTLAPDELNDVTLAALAAANQLLGACPTTGKPVFMKSGPHGPYVQRGDNADADKARQSLLQGQVPADIDLAMALRLLDLPLTLGVHPTSGVPIVAHVGKHGPYIKCGEESRSLPRGVSPLDVTLDAALALLAEPKRGKGSRGKSASIRSLGVSPLTGKPVDVRDGKYGLYVTDGQTNATLPEGVAPDEVNLEQALGLIAARPPKKRKRR